MGGHCHGVALAVDESAVPVCSPNLGHIEHIGLLTGLLADAVQYALGRIRLTDTRVEEVLVIHRHGDRESVPVDVEYELTGPFQALDIIRVGGILILRRIAFTCLVLLHHIPVAVVVIGLGADTADLVELVQVQVINVTCGRVEDHPVSDCREIADAQDTGIHGVLDGAVTDRDLGEIPVPEHNIHIIVHYGVSCDVLLCLPFHGVILFVDSYGIGKGFHDVPAEVIICGIVCICLLGYDDDRSDSGKRYRRYREHQDAPYVLLV